MRALRTGRANKNGKPRGLPFLFVLRRHPGRLSGSRPESVSNLVDQNE
jgi:hypothetical protein